MGTKRFYKIFIEVRGFTLLEILVSMLILSMVSILVLQGLRIGYKVWEKGESKVAHNHRVRIALDTISKQLSSVYPFFVKDEEGNLSLMFKVEPKMVKFITSRPIGLSNRGGLFYVIYTLINDSYSEKMSLVAYQKPIYMIKDFEDIDINNEEAIKLITDIVDIEWSHSSWGEGKLEMPEEIDEKEKEKSLPKEVMLTLKHREGENTYLTQVTIPLMVASKRPSLKERAKT
ncbi:MAG: prepilin-type N-terminal cleavage/methylation domain-containing protein [Nitrospinota bacterium]|jgi:prepilin-type N-terminal cleavage/methylation domain-containing protein